GRRITATLRPDQPLLLGVVTRPFAHPSEPFDAATFERLRKSCAEEWNRQIDSCAALELPEPIINRAWKALLIADLMIASGHRPNYSAGNAYENIWTAECGDSLRALMLLGLAQSTRDMIDPLLTFKQKGLEEHN